MSPRQTHATSKILEIAGDRSGRAADSACATRRRRCSATRPSGRCPARDRRHRCEYAEDRGETNCEAGQPRGAVCSCRHGSPPVCARRGDYTIGPWAPAGLTKAVCDQHFVALRIRLRAETCCGNEPCERRERPSVRKTSCRSRGPRHASCACRGGSGVTEAWGFGERLHDHIPRDRRLRRQTRPGFAKGWKRDFRELPRDRANVAR